jgi:pimeloyl-ACP methyl ester carboxylesterase
MRLLKRLFLFVSLVVLVAGIGFWMRPVSYLNEVMYAQECLSGIKSTSVQVTGYRIHYLVEGPVDGPVVVLVHGLGSSAEDYRDLAPYLAKTGFRVYIPDLLGYGRSQKPASFSYSVHDEAAIVSGFMDALGLKQVDLAGWSMGGGIVQHVAADHPKQVKRLIMFDSIGIYVVPAWNVQLFTPQTPEQVNQLDALLTPNPAPVPVFIARDIVRISDKRGWVIHRALESMLTGQDATDKLLPQLKMPVLMIWGAEDQIVLLSQAETMHSLVPQSQLVVIPGCGHLAPRVCAAQVATPLLAFEKQ